MNAGELEHEVGVRALDTAAVPLCPAGLWEVRMLARLCAEELCVLRKWPRCSGLRWPATKWETGQSRSVVSSWLRQASVLDLFPPGVFKVTISSSQKGLYILLI